MEKALEVVVEVEEAKIVPNFQSSWASSNWFSRGPGPAAKLSNWFSRGPGARRSAVVSEGTPTLWYNVSPVQKVWEVDVEKARA